MSDEERKKHHTIVDAAEKRRLLSSFIKDAWNVVEPSTPYMHNWHIDLISEYLTAVTLGEIKRIIFNIAPRHMKSRQISTFWPVWEWIDEPNMRYLFSSYAIDLARDHSRERRSIILSDWYQERWGDRYKLLYDQNVVTYYANDKGGRMQARGTGGAGTGKGGNRVIVDDPHNTKQAESKTQREAALYDFNQNLITRLDNPKTGAIVVVMQRLHASDLTGDILKNHDNYVHVKIPSIAEKRTIITFPLTGMRIAREKDAVLWNKRMGMEELNDTKISLGTNGFQAQHQQDPVAEGGNRIKLSWFPRFRVAPINPQRCIQSWDTGLKPRDTSAPSVGLTFMFNGEHWLLVDMYKKQVGYPELKRAVRNKNQIFNPECVLIEDKASGISLIQEFKEESGISPIPIEPEADKITRMETQSPHLEAGNIALPESAPWLGEVELALEQFPENDEWDIIDALSQFLKWQFGRKSSIQMQKLSGH